MTVVSCNRKIEEIADFTVFYTTSTTCRTFEHIVLHKDKSVQVAAKTMAMKVLERIKGDSFFNAHGHLLHTPVESLLAAATLWMYKDRQSMFQRLTIAPLKPLWMFLLCRTLKLDFKIVQQWNSDYDGGHLELRDGIFLAGLYLTAKELKADLDRLH